MGKELAQVGPGSCFGELALLRRDARAATVKAITDARVGAPPSPAPIQTQWPWHDTLNPGLMPPRHETLALRFHLPLPPHQHR